MTLYPYVNPFQPSPGPFPPYQAPEPWTTGYPMVTYTSPQQGWQCPACKTCYAPFVDRCTCSTTEIGNTCEGDLNT